MLLFEPPENNAILDNKNEESLHDFNTHNDLDTNDASEDAIKFEPKCEIESAKAK